MMRVMCLLTVRGSCLVLACLAFLGCSSRPWSGSGADGFAAFQSELGFSARMPSSWRVVDRRSLREDPDRIAAALFGPKAERSPTRGSSADDLRRVEQIRSQIESGESEFYFPFPAVTAVSGSTDIVTGQKKTGRIPADDAELAALCPQISQQLSHAYAQPVELKTCELMSRKDGAEVFRFESAGTVLGSTLIHYQLPYSETTVLAFTSATEPARTEELRVQLEAFVVSVRIDAP